MALQGDLTDFSAAEIFQLIGTQTKTGVLTVRHADDVVTVCFIDGEVVAADSLQRNVEERIGQVLCRQGHITQEQLAAALRQQNTNFERVGALLVGKGLVTEEVLEEAVKVQVRQAIFRLFRWNRGFYQFNQGEALPQELRLQQPLRVEELLMEAARIVDEWPLIREWIPSLDVVYRPTALSSSVELRVAEELGPDPDLDQPPEPGEVLEVSASFARLFERVSTRVTARELVETGERGEFEAYRQLGRLVALGLVEPAEGVEEDAPAEDEEEPTEERRETPTEPSTAARWLTRTLPRLAVVSWAIYGLVASLSSPVSFLPRASALESGAGARLAEAWTSNRLDRAERALGLFHATRGRHPDSLAELEQAGLLPPVGHHPPLAPTLVYERLPDGGFELSALDHRGLLVGEPRRAQGAPPAPPEDPVPAA